MELQRHPHYQYLRAFADGWSIEYYDTEDDAWLPVATPYFVTEARYRIVPDSDGWIPWYGKDPIPVPPDTLVDIILSDGTQTKGKPAGHWNWNASSFPVTHYRLSIVPQPTPVPHWQWIYKDTMGNYGLTTHFYPDEETAKTTLSNVDQLISRAEWTRIEVLGK